MHMPNELFQLVSPTCTLTREQLVLTPSLSLMLRGKYLDHLGQSVTLLTLNLKQMHRGRWEIYYRLSFHSQWRGLELEGPTAPAPVIFGWVGFRWLIPQRQHHAHWSFYSCWVSLLEYIVYFHNIGAK